MRPLDWHACSQPSSSGGFNTDLVRGLLSEAPRAGWCATIVAPKQAKEITVGEAKRKRLLAQQRTINPASQASSWPLANPVNFDTVVSALTRQGIDCATVGFHDSPAFVAAERVDPSVLELLARFVESRSYSDAELETAERVIRAAAETVQAAVEADGRPGLCVVASGVLSRILDALGVWNYCAKATLTVEFPPEVSSSTRHFYSIDQGSFEAPHAVVIAPPFTLVDITARYQAYDTLGMAEALPRLVMDKTFTPYRWAVEDIVAPEMAPLRRGGRAGLEAFLRNRNQPMLRAMRDLPGRQVALSNGGSLRYVVCGVGGYIEQLADLHGNANLNGQSPISLLRDVILPRLSIEGITVGQ